MRDLANKWQAGLDHGRAGKFSRRVCNMFTRKRRTVAAGAALIVLFSATSASALEASQNGAGKFVATVGQQVIDALGTQAPDQRERHFRSIFVHALDLEAIGRRALGRHWRTASDKDRDRYLSLFREYVVNIYAVQLNGYTGERFTVLRHQPASQSESVVTARIVREHGAPMDLRFNVTQGEFGYKIVDVNISGVSLVVTKRSEFDAIIRREGLPGLLRRLEDKSASVIEQRSRRKASALAEIMGVLRAGRSLILQ